MFDEFENLGERAVSMRGKLGAKITAAIAMHSEIEKAILYPPFKQRAENHEELQQILEAFEEHALVDGLVAQIKALDARDETYEAKVKTVIDLVLHHVKEEEGELFPSTRELFEKAELVEMGRRASAMKAGEKVPEPA
jgi:hemerythrin superfamily protein